MPRGVDIFVHLPASPAAGSEVHRVWRHWTRPDVLGAIARRLTAVTDAKADGLLPSVSSGWVVTQSPSPVHVLSTAFAAAGRDGIPLLVLLGPLDVDANSVAVLRQALADDPMFGFAVARTGCADRCCVMSLSRNGIEAGEWVPRRILAHVPEREILVELAGRCVLIAPTVLGNFAPLDRRFETVAGALLECMARARRCGFRTVLCNRAVVGVEGLSCAAQDRQGSAAVSARDGLLLREAVPDLERNWREFRGGSWERFERLGAVNTKPSKGASRRSLLLDIRNVAAIHNGTAHAALGVANGLRALEPDWDIALLANPHGAVFHDLARVYDGWPVYSALPDRPFTATLRPSQPWHIQEMADLHSVSLFNVYLLLDTIAWDITYAAPRYLEGVWQFMASHADGFLFDSEFTRQRFLQRFPVGRMAPGRVSRLSFDPSDYVLRNGEASRHDGSILVIGNNLDHKDVSPTVEALASAFPFRRLTTIGPSRIGSPFVTSHPSGALPEQDVQRLYASAEYVVFPSFYEGFGFPVVTALAYGRTVLARRSSLLDEIAARCQPRGRLIAFDSREELVELLGRLIHGEPVTHQPLGTETGGSTPRKWRDVGREALEFMEEIASEPARSRWIERERTIQQLLSYRS